MCAERPMGTMAASVFKKGSAAVARADERCGSLTDDAEVVGSVDAKRSINNSSKLERKHASCSRWVAVGKIETLSDEGPACVRS